MITLHAMRNVDGDKLYAYDFKGLSTDEKPTFWGGKVIEVNSMFLEEDTGDFYYVESQGSKGEPTKTVLIEEQSFTGTRDYTDWYFYKFEVVELVQDVLFIKFDGTEYRCTKTVYGTGDIYGAPFDDMQYDFSTYPFCVIYDSDPQSSATFIVVPDGSEHTVEVYTMEGGDTPAVWKKVGSGS